MQSTVALASPARYTPWTKGTYDVSPSLKGLGYDFGNGRADALWFQIDDRYEEFLDGKRQALSEDAGKYVFEANLSTEVAEAAFEAMTEQLALEHPDIFSKSSQGIARAWDGAQATNLNELSLLVQEDFCIVRFEDGKDWLAYANVCAPSHWLAAEKIGRSFFNIHTVVPHFESVNQVAGKMVDAMINKGPFVRFVWGVESDPRPNHHPIAPPGIDPNEWEGRDFSKGKFWCRAERQVMWGLPKVSATIFTIRVSHLPCEEVLADPYLKETLIASLHSMSPETRRYKGLDKSWDHLMRLLA